MNKLLTAVLLSSVITLSVQAQKAEEYYVKHVEFPPNATLEQKVDMAARLIPTPQQLSWQQMELTAFLHFGINTFTGREWGDGKEDPALFNPSELKLAEGTKVLDCEPHATIDIQLGNVILSKKDREAYLNVSWTRKEDSPMIDKDWEVAYDQFVLSGNKNSTAHRPQKAGETTFTVDKKTGALTSLSLNGKELLSTPLTLSLFRPATDNDNRDRNGARLWRKAGLDNITQKVLSLKEGKSSTTARVEILNAKGQKVGTADFIYALDKNGALKVSTTFEPDTALVKSIARLGVTFRVADMYDQVSYLGRGDNETYADRNQSGRIGLYQTTPERMFHYYVTPQSTGNRTDVRWAKFTDHSGAGIFVESNRAFQFSIIPFSDVLLEKARHINDLKRDGMLTVHLDAEQAGVGTATCGPGVLPQYLVPLKKQHFEFTLYPVK